jgi:hypothetical protein
MNWSIQAKADVAGMSRRDLYRDRDFRWVLEDVVTSCKIDDKI